jgi:hypothetical protein
MWWTGAIVLAASGLASAAAPTCNLVPGWTQRGEARSYVADNLFEYMDGNAEGYLLYSFMNMAGVTCERSGVQLTIDVSEFADPDFAFGMFSANRDMRQPMAKLGMGGQIVPRKAVFAKGKYYVEIGANPEGDHTAVLQQWMAVLDARTEGTSNPPAALAWFPAAGQQSLRLVPASVLGIRLLRRGYVGQYDFGQAFVVTEDSPASATAIMERLRARFPGGSAVKIGDEAYQVTDQYMGRMCIFRKGQLIGGYGKLTEGQDGVALSTALAAKLP